MKRRIWIWFLFTILLYFQYRLWFSQHGLIYMWNLEQDITTQIDKNNKALKCNKSLADEILYFRNSPEALEERARYEFDMIKQDEVFVSIFDEEPQEESLSECEILQ